MPELTATSAEELSRLENRLNDLKRKSTQAIKAAAKKVAKATTDVARNKARTKLNDQRAARAGLNREQAQLLELEKAYERSTRHENEAIKDLRRAARDAGALVKGIRRATDILNAVGKFSGIVVKLIGLLP